MSGLRRVYGRLAALVALLALAAGCGGASTSSRSLQFASAAGVDKSGKPFSLLRFTPDDRSSFVSGTTVQRHRSGDFVIGGVFQGTVDLGTGRAHLDAPRTAFVGRFSPSGRPVWIDWMGAADETGPRVAIDHAGNVALALNMRFTPRPFGDKEPDCGDRKDCSFAPAFYLLDETGQVKAGRSFATHDAREAMTVTAVELDDENVTVAGRFGQTDAFVARYSTANAERRWFTRLRTVPGPDGARGDVGSIAGIALAPDGDVIVAGQTIRGLFIDDATLPSRAAHEFRVRLDRAEGTVKWMTIGEEISGETSGTYALAAGPNGDFFVVSHANASGANQAVIQRIDGASGKARWTRAMPMHDGTLAGARIAVADGVPLVLMKVTGRMVNAVTSGPPTVYGAANTKTEAILALEPETGTTAWARQLRTPIKAEPSWTLDGTSLAAVSKDEVVVTGSFSGRADLGGLAIEGPWRHEHRACFDDDDDDRYERVSYGRETRRDCGDEWSLRSMFVARVRR